MCLPRRAVRIVGGEIRLIRGPDILAAGAKCPLRFNRIGRWVRFLVVD
jgi:hypothetical protein